MAMEAQGIRFVSYPQTPLSFDASKVWERILPGREPENIQRPKAGLPGVTQSLASGAVRDLDFTITVQPTRVDFLAGRRDPFFAETRQPTTVEALLTAAALYGGKIIDLSGSTRLALVLDMVDLAEDWEEAIEKIRIAVPINQLPATAREVNFALNAPRQFSAVPDLEMNRLCKWETALYHYFYLQAGSPTPMGGQPSRHFALSMQLDLSSGLRQAALDTGTGHSILAELCQEIRLLVSEGYTRLIA